MITFNVIYVDGSHNRYIEGLEKEFIKRLGVFAKVNLIKVNKQKLFSDSNIKGIERAKFIEAERIEKKIKGYSICLEIKGKSINSESFATVIKNLSITGISNISFIIGGSNGLDPEFIKRCDYNLSFSKLTFPHQLMRVILLEQIYRSMCIINGKIYHK